MPRTARPKKSEKKTQKTEEKPEEKQTSAYRGVRWSGGARKFASCIQWGGQVFHLGYFLDETAAAMAYDAAAKEGLGDAAKLNFPDLKGKALATERKRCEELEAQLKSAAVLLRQRKPSSVAQKTKGKSPAKCAGKRSGKAEAPKSVYQGVFWHKGAKKFVACIRWGGQGFHLGYFADEKAAAMAYDVAAKEGHGDNAKLNFPDLKPQTLAKAQKRCEEEEEKLKARKRKAGSYNTKSSEGEEQRRKKRKSKGGSGTSSAKQRKAAENNVVLAWSLDPDCPWEVTNSEDDLIDYPDFAESWDFDGQDIPEARNFSRLVQELERPDGSGNVGKHTNNFRYKDPRHGGPRQNNRAKPFTYVAWKED